jgi:hypothetical protein
MVLHGLRHVSTRATGRCRRTWPVRGISRTSTMSEATIDGGSVMLPASRTANGTLRLRLKSCCRGSRTGGQITKLKHGEHRGTDRLGERVTPSDQRRGVQRGQAVAAPRQVGQPHTTQLNHPKGGRSEPEFADARNVGQASFVT